MIEEHKHVGTHADQRREGLINALKVAGIGRTYADRSLDDAGELGASMKAWLLANHTRISEGYGFDFRGTGPKAVDLVNLTARAVLRIGYSTMLVPLVRLPKLINDPEHGEFLKRVHCLIIRDFQTQHETPLRSYEVAEVEALIEERMTDAKSVCVVRKDGAGGWWSQTTEDLIEANCRVVEVR